MAEAEQKRDVAAPEAAAAPGGSMLESLMATGAAVASAGMAKAAELDKQYKVSETAVATAQMGMEKAKELDEKFGVSEKAKATVKGAVGKAMEMNEKYAIADKAGKVLETSVNAAKAADAKLGVSSRVASGVEKVKQVDETYGVSKKVTAKISEVDKKLGVSEKVIPIVNQVDENLGVSKNIAAAKDAAMEVMGISVFKGNAKIDDGHEFVPIVVSAAKRTLSFKEQVVPIPENVTADIAGATVKLGNFSLTFATASDAAQFVSFIGKMNEEEVQAAEPKTKNEEEVQASTPDLLEL